MLNYHNTGTIYMKGYLHSRKPILHPRPGTLTLNNQTNNQTNHSEVNNRTYNANAPPTGLTEELTKSHPVIDEELIVRLHKLLINPSLTMHVLFVFSE